MDEFEESNIALLFQIRPDNMLCFESEDVKPIYDTLSGRPESRLPAVSFDIFGWSSVDDSHD